MGQLKLAPAISLMQVYIDPGRRIGHEKGARIQQESPATKLPPSWAPSALPHSIASLCHPLPASFLTLHGLACSRGHPLSAVTWTQLLAICNGCKGVYGTRTAFWQHKVPLGLGCKYGYMRLSHALPSSTLAPSLPFLCHFLCVYFLYCDPSGKGHVFSSIETFMDTEDSQ